MAENEDPPKRRKVLEAEEGLLAGFRGAPETASNEDEPPDELQAITDEGVAIEREVEALRKQRERERELAKFTANALDRASTSLLTLGLIGPGVGVLYHTTLMAALTGSELVVATISCLGLAFVLHSVGRAVLNEVFLR
ncbi:hypothetical protein [Mesorhizobium sp. ES1-3]|uniref:hypothetical protein n=1 Tax=Mesorhizobium sp. ES1-3 TaxID=2876628 RepID=UPI001CCEBF28|nr:hypothetical protein [Mesorhizobium sp. ES1-3]MBZ9673311.1 hypothetical protein [Mesorhizobium sp. ES1-3]